MVQYRTFTGMHSVMDMIFPAMTNEDADTLYDKIRSEAETLENLLSDYDPAAETSILNDKARYQWMPVSDRLWDILVECRHYHTRTGGYFDIGSGWHKKACPGVSASSVTGIRLLESDEGTRRIRFSAPEISLDFGAVGKGLLLRETDKILTRYGVKNCFISFGGSSILTRGHHPHGDCWPVEMRNSPAKNSGFRMNDDFASFSKGIPDGINATAHIVNPRTNKTEANSRISGVQAGCPVIAEVSSTALILASPDEMAFLAKTFRVKRAFVTGGDSANPNVKEFFYES